MSFRARAVLLLATAALAASPAMAQVRRIPVDLTPLVDSNGVHAGTTVRVALKAVLPEGFHVQADKPRDPTLIPTQVTIDPPAGVTVEELVFPKAKDFAMEGLPEPLLVFEREFVIGVRLGVAAGVVPGDLTIPVRLRYQACDDTTCFPPRTVSAQWDVKVVGASAAVTPQYPDVFGAIAFGTGQKPAAASQAAAAEAPAAAEGVEGGLAQLDNFTVVASTGGYLGANDFLTFIKNAESGVVEKGLFEGRGPLAILLIVLIGGLALNLTPCVLPMIPINLAIIGAGAQASSRQRGFLLGLVYGGAMAVVYGVLGLIVVLTASTFGTINASPWFNVGIAVLFVVLALAMFDVFEIDLSRFSANVGGGSGKGTFLLAFSMGAVAALLAGACVAPVVIQVVLFSSSLYATGTTIALALPFFLGVGMAIPWPLAGAGLASLPKPGPWMVRVKQVFGVLIMGMAVYYGYLAYSIFANRWVDSTQVASSVQEMLKEGWHPSLAAGLAQAEREGKPVLVDMWATWCKNCLTMDKTTLADPSVKQALDGYVKIKFQAEQPDEAPAVDVMKRFKAVGLPAYVILKPRTAQTASN